MNHTIFSCDNFLCRPWQPADQPGCLAMIAQVLVEFDYQFEPEGYEKDLLDIENVYLASGGCFWVVVDGAGEIAGTGGFHPDPRNQRAVEVRKMYLRKDARGLGLGGRLLSTLEDHARLLGYEEAWLETMDRLEGAVRLYERAGYRREEVASSLHQCERVYRKALLETLSGSP